MKRIFLLLCCSCCQLSPLQGFLVPQQPSSFFSIRRRRIQSVGEGAAASTTTRWQTASSTSDDNDNDPSHAGVAAADDTTAATTTTRNNKDDGRNDEDSAGSPPPTAFASFAFDPRTGQCVQPRHFCDEQQGRRFALQNVPGEGDCLFLAVAVALLASSGLSSLIEPVLWKESHAVAREWRQRVAQVLMAADASSLALGETHTVAAPNWVSTRALLQQAAHDEGMTSTREYVAALQTLGATSSSALSSLYGGGPELAVLSNLLRRPIAVYEVLPPTTTGGGATTTTATKKASDDDSSCCPIACVGTFGAKVFDDPLRLAAESSDPAAAAVLTPWPLHILIVQTKDAATTTTGEQHALALLPIIVQ